METIKEVKQWFAEEMFSWTCEQDYEDPNEYHNLIKWYVEDIEFCDPNWERENLCRETWYVEWYAQALRSIKYQIESSNNKLITLDAIDYYLNN